MRILHIIHQFYPDHTGGTEHYTRTLAQTQQQAGHEVAILCRQAGTGQHLDRTETEDGLVVYRAVQGALTPRSRFRATFGDAYLAECLREVLATTAPDLVHIQHLMGLPLPAMAALKAYPAVVTLHDYWWVCANAQLLTNYSQQVCAGPRAWLNCARCGLVRAGVGDLWPLAPLVALLFAWRAALLSRVGRHVRAWIAPTRFVAQWYVAHGLPAARMHVVGHGIEPPRGQRRTRPDTGPLEVAYVGGLAPQKGVHLLVEACRPLSTAVTLTIAGDEEAFPAYVAGLRQQAAAGQVRFTGRLDRDGVWSLLSRVDLVVVPSLWYETASLIVQEAFAVGTPVVAADHGALSERVRHEVDGLLFAPGNEAALTAALQRCIDEPHLLENLRAGIRPPLGRREHAGQIQALYDQIVDR